MSTKVPINLSKYTEREITSMNLDGDRVDDGSFMVGKSSSGKTITLNIGVSTEIGMQNPQPNDHVQVGKIQNVVEEKINKKSFFVKLLDKIKSLLR